MKRLYLWICHGVLCFKYTVKKTSQPKVTQIYSVWLLSIAQNAWICTVNRKLHAQARSHCTICDAMIDAFQKFHCILLVWLFFFCHCTHLSLLLVIPSFTRVWFLIQTAWTVHVCSEQQWELCCLHKTQTALDALSSTFGHLSTVIRRTSPL